MSATVTTLQACRCPGCSGSTRTIGRDRRCKNPRCEFHDGWRLLFGDELGKKGKDARTQLYAVPYVDGKLNGKAAIPWPRVLAKTEGETA